MAGCALQTQEMHVERASLHVNVRTKACVHINTPHVWGRFTCCDVPFGSFDLATP